MWAPPFSSARNDASRPVRRSGLVTVADSGAFGAPATSESRPSDCTHNHSVRPVGYASRVWPQTSRRDTLATIDARAPPSTAGALCAIVMAAPAAAQTEATAATVAKKRMHVRAGQRVAVAGAATPGYVASLQIRRRGAGARSTATATPRPAATCCAAASAADERAGARCAVGGRRAALGRAERLPLRLGVVVRPRPVRQPPRLRRDADARAASASPTRRCRAAPS